MKHLSLALVGSAILLALSGCKKEQSAGTVAVLDLDRVAVAIGWDEEMKKALETKDVELNDQLTQLKSNFKSQIDAKAGRYGETPTEEQQQELAGMANQANTALQNALGNARQQSSQYRVSLINEFRDKVRPYAEDIARERGFATILLQAEPVYYTHADTDISGEVIARMQAAGEGRATPAATPTPSE